MSLEAAFTAEELRLMGNDRVDAYQKLFQRQLSHKWISPGDRSVLKFLVPPEGVTYEGRDKNSSENFLQSIFVPPSHQKPGGGTKPIFEKGGQ